MSNNTACQIPSSWTNGGPVPPRIWSRATGDCIPCQQNVQTTFLSLLCTEFHPDLYLVPRFQGNYDFLTGYTITDNNGITLTISDATFSGSDTIILLPESGQPTNGFTVGNTYLTNYPLTITTPTYNCISTDALNMRRKAEVLQHKKNDSNTSSKTQFAELVRGNGPYRKRSWGTQNIDFTNPNVNKLTETNQFTLLCPNREKLCALTSSSDVPGKIQLLCMDRNVPLTRWIPRRTYGASGNKWPEWKWEPGMKGFPRGKSGNFLVFG